MTQRTCAVEGCERTRAARGYCDAHYRRWKKNGDPGPPDLDQPPAKTQVCSIEGCTRMRIVRLYCPLHYERWKRNGTPDPMPTRQTAAMSTCTFEGCDRPGRTLSLCAAHYLQKFQNRPIAPIIKRPDTTARDELGRKQCGTCSHWQPIDQFYSNPKTKDRLSVLCRTCHKDGVLRRNYGISLLEYTQILAAQNGACAICGALNRDGRDLFVDHDHATGDVRGLLCNLCNRGIGNMRDNAQLLRAAADYLERDHGQRGTYAGQHRTAQAHDRGST